MISCNKHRFKPSKNVTPTLQLWLTMFQRDADGHPGIDHPRTATQWYDPVTEMISHNLKSRLEISLPPSLGMGYTNAGAQQFLNPTKQTGAHFIMNPSAIASFKGVSCLIFSVNPFPFNLMWAFAALLKLQSTNRGFRNRVLLNQFATHQMDWQSH